MQTREQNPVSDLMVGGAPLWRGLLDGAAQAALLAELDAVIAAAPLFSPLTPWGKPMSVRMTSAGRYGWFTDRKGYRYIDRHPSGTPWPPIPPTALEVWRRVAGTGRMPDCCLVNLYGESARMGLHQDRDEADFAYPVVSISLGDEGRFRIGPDRAGTHESVWLASGDVLALTGPSRLAFHGIDRIRFGSSSLLPGGGRINLTLRVVDP